MKKLFISIIFVGLSAYYVFARTSIASLASAPSSTISGSSAPAPSVSTGNPITRFFGGDDGEEGGVRITPVPAPTPTPTPTPTPAPTSTPARTGYKDGVYTGSVADAFYGLVQIKATIVNGRITDVAFLQYPSDRSTSRYINGQAMPLLTQEAIQAQSANVNIISGATATSGAFQESLGVALSAAKV